MNDPRPIRLPDRFYLPRIDAEGREVRDAMPWEGAISYVTDGERLGIQYADGHAVWLGHANRLEGDEFAAPTEPVSFSDDFEGVNMDALVDGIRSYIDLHPVLKTVWRDDLQRLDALRSRRPHPNGGDPEDG